MADTISLRRQQQYAVLDGTAALQVLLGQPDHAASARQVRVLGDRQTNEQTNRRTSRSTKATDYAIELYETSIKTNKRPT